MKIRLDLSERIDELHEEWIQLQTYTHPVVRYSIADISSHPRRFRTPSPFHRLSASLSPSANDKDMFRQICFILQDIYIYIYK